MEYSIEPASLFRQQLWREIIKASADLENQWFFFDGAFSADVTLESSPNTWLHENFVVFFESKIIAYFEATWTRPLDIISGFRLILLDKSKPIPAIKAFFEYLDYLFVNRGCYAFNWTVAKKNKHAYELYEKFIKKNCGHRVGFRHHGQKSYSGEYSDIVLYELTRDEYFDWKKKCNIYIN